MSCVRERTEEGGGICIGITVEYCDRMLVEILRFSMVALTGVFCRGASGVVYSFFVSEGDFHCNRITSNLTRPRCSEKACFFFPSGFCDQKICPRGPHHRSQKTRTRRSDPSLLNQRNACEPIR